MNLLFSTIASVVTTSVPQLSSDLVVVATEILLVSVYPLLVSLLAGSNINWFLVIFTPLILILALSDLGDVDTEKLLVSVFALLILSLLGGSSSNWFLVMLISLILILLLLLWLLFLRRLLNNRFTRSWRMGIGSVSVLTHFFDGKTRIFFMKKVFFCKSS